LFNTAGPPFFFFQGIPSAYRFLYLPLFYFFFRTRAPLGVDPGSQSKVYPFHPEVVFRSCFPPTSNGVGGTRATFVLIPPLCPLGSVVMGYGFSRCFFVREFPGVIPPCSDRPSSFSAPRCRFFLSCDWSRYILAAFLCAPMWPCPCASFVNSHFFFCVHYILHLTPVYHIRGRPSRDYHPTFLCFRRVR